MRTQGKNHSAKKNRAEPAAANQAQIELICYLLHILFFSLTWSATSSGDSLWPLLFTSWEDFVGALPQDWSLTGTFCLLLWHWYENRMCCCCVWLLSCFRATGLAGSLSCSVLLPCSVSLAALWLSLHPGLSSLCFSSCWVWVRSPAT